MSSGPKADCGRDRGVAADGITAKLSGAKIYGAILPSRNDTSVIKSAPHTFERTRNDDGVTT